MHIAFISHEFPPDTGGGGIGTYLDQVARLLAARGHTVEIFAGATGPASASVRADGVLVHRIPATSSPAFREAVIPAFAAAHQQRPFDVCEGNDFDASALGIKRAFPRLPYVVKLHTPRFLIDELHHHPPTLAQRVRIALGALRRGRWPESVPLRRQPQAQSEIASIVAADEIASPSQAIADAAMSWARLDPSRISVFPYPYEPPAALLAIPVDAPATRRITFLGRLEERKGVQDFAAAIPLILRQQPDCRFRFIGRSMPTPSTGLDLRTTLEANLQPFHHAVEFTGPLPPAAIPQALAETDILIAPSHWESFGLVCCEGMAAARAVIGSSHGGMAEILDGGRCGELIPPHDPAAIARLVLKLMTNPARRHALGAAGRQRVLETYGAERIMQLQLASYDRAIACTAPQPS